MNASLLDPVEVKRAQIGPRQMKDPKSREYAIQTLYALKLYLDSKDADEDRVKQELKVIQENRHWEVLGYPNLDDYLKAETGRSLQELLGEARKNAIAAVCAIAREQGPPVNGGDRKSKNQSDNCKADSKCGNDPVYLARRILGVDSEVFEKLEQGEYRSVRSAAIAAGVIKVKQESTLMIAQRAWKRMTEDEQRDFLRWISTDAEEPA